MAGKSVLFSAKNHQAVTEVEDRLKEIVSDLPLLTRARDAEGERDVSFLDALTHIAHDQSREIRAEAIDIVKAKDSILQRAEGQQEARRKVSEQTSMHLALSELAERHEILSRHAKIKKTRQGFRNWLARLLQVLRFLPSLPADPLEPLPDDASVREIDDRISELQTLLAKQGSAESPIEASLDAEEAALSISSHRAPFDNLDKLLRDDLNDSVMADRIAELRERQAKGTGLFVWRGLKREE
jgi:hypothetical protein